LCDFRRIHFFRRFVQLGALEYGIQALDGADAHLAVLGDVGRLEPLHVVQLGEFAVIVERGKGHHFLLGLLAEVLGVDQEQHALGMRVFEQAIDGSDGGVGLACAGRHLDQRSRPVVLERFFQIGDGAFLAVAQAQFAGGQVIRVQRWNVVQTCTQTVALAQPFLERFRAVEIEHFARARLGIAAIGKTGDDAGALVQERQRLLVVDPLELGGGVAFGLRFVRGEALAFFLALGFDDADGLLVHEQHVVGRTDIGLVFAHCQPQPCAQVYFLCRLHNPTRLLQQRVDGVAGFLFGVLVLGHCQSVRYFLCCPRPVFKVTNCDLEDSYSSGDNWNMKSSGNRSAFRLTAAPSLQSANSNRYTRWLVYAVWPIPGRPTLEVTICDVKSPKQKAPHFCEAFVFMASFFPICP